MIILDYQGQEIVPIQEEIQQPEILERDQERVVREMLRTLKPKQAEIVLRRDFMKQTWAEIAEYFGTTKEPIRQHYAKALRLLRHPFRLRILSEVSGFSIINMNARFDEEAYKAWVIHSAKNEFFGRYPYNL